MTRWLLGRFAGAVGAIFGASIIGFLFMRLLPGNPARLIAGPLAPQAAVDQLVEEMGLNKSIPQQYYEYITAYMRGDWGFSFSTGQPVREAFVARLPATIELALCAFTFAFVTALVLALLATYRRRPVFDGAVRSAAYFGLGTPTFWFGLVLLIVFFDDLHVLPGPEGRLSVDQDPPPTVTHLYTVDALLAGDLSTFGDALRHLILPAVALALPIFALLVRLLRANLLEVSREPFIVVLRSKGLSRWAIFSRHALFNAFLPTLTIGGLLLAELLAGSVLVEKVFNWPGVGAYVVDAVLRQDYAVVQAFILISAIIYVIVNFVVDLLYGVIDPRVRVTGGLRE